MPVKYLDPLSDKQIDALLLAAPRPLVFLGGNGDGWQSILSWRATGGIDSNGTDGSDLIEFIQEASSHNRRLVGFVSYDFGERQSGMQRTKGSASSIPELFVRSFDEYIVFTTKHTEIHYSNDSFVQEFTELVDMLQANERPNSKITFQAAQQRASYEQSFNAIRRYIKEGDVYQLNLTHELVADASAVSSRQLYVDVARENRVSYQAYIEADNFELLSFSPECFLRTSGKVIETMPIKGTIARGHDPKQDRQNKQLLQDSSKENAELNMITDLLRNDLGKVCTVGSVEVVENRMLTPHKSVWHAHSRIKGDLLAEYSPIEALLSMSPGGSITGCPKRRAMEIIAELEPTKRGVYTGSIFSIDADEDMDSSIVIRTIVREGDRLSLRVGGGIVADSDGDAEYRETFAKAKALTDVLE